MPILPNNRHELFAQGLATGLSADAAYQAAGYKPNRGNAATLKANQSISKRVEDAGCCRRQDRTQPSVGD